VLVVPNRHLKIFLLECLKVQYYLQPFITSLLQTFLPPISVAQQLLLMTQPVLSQVKLHFWFKINYQLLFYTITFYTHLPDIRCFDYRCSFDLALFSFFFCSSLINDFTTLQLYIYIYITIRYTRTHF
jgi:hypothetical protein